MNQCHLNPSSQLVITVIFLLIAQLGFDDSPDAAYANPIDLLLEQYMVVISFFSGGLKLYLVSILTFPFQVVAYIAYGAAMLALIVLRWKKPDTDTWKRDFKVTLKSE